MANRPPKVVKVKKNGIELLDGFDRTQYFLHELIMAANREVGNFIRKRMIQKVKKLPGMKRSKRPYRAFQFWARRRENDLIIGVKHATWYGENQEKGTNGQPKRDIIRGTVYEHIDDIRRIQGQFLSAIEDENKALGLIDEDDDGVGDTIG